MRGIFAGGPPGRSLLKLRVLERVDRAAFLFGKLCPARWMMSVWFAPDGVRRQEPAARVVDRPRFRPGLRGKKRSIAAIPTLGKAGLRIFASEGAAHVP